MTTPGLDEPILVDTSVWVDYFRRKEPVYEKINQLVEEEKVAIIKLVVAELIQGAKSRKEVGVITDLAEVVPVLEEKNDSWEKAGILAFDLRRKGQTVGLADCYIAILAISHKTLLYSFDQHFQTLSEHLSLQLLS